MSDNRQTAGEFRTETEFHNPMDYLSTLVSTWVTALNLLKDIGMQNSLDEERLKAMTDIAERTERRIREVLG